MLDRKMIFVEKWIGNYIMISILNEAMNRVMTRQINQNNIPTCIAINFFIKVRRKKTSLYNFSTNCGIKAKSLYCNKVDFCKISALIITILMLCTRRKIMLSRAIKSFIGYLIMTRSFKDNFSQLMGLPK